MKNDYNPPILSLESENRYTDPNPSINSELIAIEDEEMDLLARIEKLEQNINESASKLQIKERIPQNDEEIGLEKIQEESDVECSRHLSIYQEKQSPLKMVSDIEQIPKDNHNYDISEPEQEVEEEMVFINVYPDKRKFDENPQNQEKAKKAGFLNHWKEEKQDSFVIEEKKKLDDEEIAKIDKEEKKKKGGAPKLPFVNHIKEINDVEEQHEVKEVSEEENSKFRYSKMDEKQAEILYKERFNQLLNKFSQNNVNAAAAGQTMKKNTKPPVSNKTHEPLDNNQNYIVKMATPKKQINVNNKNTSNLNKRSSNPSEKMLQGSEEARKDNKGIRRGLLLYSKAVEQQKMKELFVEENTKIKELEEMNLCTFTPALTKKASFLKNYENIVDKTKKFAEKFESKFKINKLQKFEKELENCTFSPKINKRAPNLPKSNSSDDFYRKQISWKKRMDSNNFRKANSPFCSNLKDRSSSRRTFKKDESFISKSSNQNNSMLNKCVSPQSTRSEYSNKNLSNNKKSISTVKKIQTPKKITNLLGNYMHDAFYSKKVQPYITKKYIFTNNKENLSKQINDTFTIFQNIREHFTNKKVTSNRKNTPAKNTVGFGSFKKKNRALELNNESLNKSIKNGKKEIDKVANSLVFKSIPNNQNCSYLSEKKKSNENRYDQFFTLDKKEALENRLKFSDQKKKKKPDLKNKFNDIIEKANAITNYMKKKM